jgi:hypothetical protein
MAVSVCPHCGKQGRVPDKYIGRKVRCPQCQETFAVEPPPAAATMAPMPSPVQARPTPPSPPDGRPARAARPKAPAPPAEDDLEEVGAEDELVGVPVGEEELPDDGEESLPPPARRIRYLAAYGFVFQNPRWFTNVLLFAVCALIPVVGGLAAMGYGYEVLASLIRRRKGTYPDFEFGRFGDYLKRGLWPFLVGLLIGFPVALVLQVMLSVLGFVLARISPALALLTEPLFALGMFALCFLLVPLQLRSGVGRSLDLGGGFRFTVDFNKRVGARALLVYLFLGVTGSVVALVGLVICCVGVLGSAAVVTLASMFLYNELYQLHLDRGGEPIPVQR